MQDSVPVSPYERCKVSKRFVLRPCKGSKDWTLGEGNRGGISCVPFNPRNWKWEMCEECVWQSQLMKKRRCVGSVLISPS